MDLKIKVQGKILSGMVINTLRTHLPMLPCVEKGDKILVSTQDKKFEVSISIKEDQIKVIEPQFEYDNRAVKYLGFMSVLPSILFAVLFFVAWGWTVIIPVVLSTLFCYYIHHKTYQKQIGDYSVLYFLYRRISETLTEAYSGVLDLPKKEGKK